jgi:hypothetical protein
MHQNLDLLRAMVEKGADVTARDMSGSTALMWAASNDSGETAVIQELLEMGLDPNATNQAGETALTWASRRGQTPVVSMLRSAGASDTALIKDSAQRALTLLQTSGTQFVKVSGCVSCHHQFLPQMTAAVARDRGLDVDESSARAQTEATVGMFKPLSAEMLRSKDRIPDPPISVSYALLALAADNYTADETTAAMAQLSNVADPSADRIERFCGNGSEHSRAATLRHRCRESRLARARLASFGRAEHR